jgi:prepilin-type N-terminal cleavage/methylation domain-containing protein
MTATNSDREGEAAFTLIEMLIAIAIAAAAGSILAGLLTYFDRQRSETYRRMQEHKSILDVERIVRSVLVNAPPFLPGVLRRSAVTGGRREAWIVSSGPPALGLPRTVAFGLRLATQGSSQDLILSWPDEVGKERREVLAASVSELAFDYLSLRPDLMTTWESQRTPEEGPLSALRLTLRFRSCAKTHVVVVPVDADLPVACLRDSRQIGCASGDEGG